MSTQEPALKPLKTPYYKDVAGDFRIPGYFSEEAFHSTVQYQPRDDDLFVVTFPKCGTTWMQHIVSSIYRCGKPFDNGLEFLTESPFLEMTGAEAAKTMKRPGAIKIHLPFRLAPWSANAKYIFVARNPKDCCVSFYHHTVNLIAYDFQDGKFDDYFEIFIRGKTDFGDYFDTLMSWYEHKDDPNVLFITYEQLQKDIKSSVLRVAEFVGPQYKEMLQKDEKMLNDVIYHSSYGFLKKTLNDQFAELAALPRDLILNNSDLPQGIREMFGSEVGVFKKKDPLFVRKGIVGDWRVHFTSEQNRRLEEKFRERTAGTNLEDIWKDDMF